MVVFWYSRKKFGTNTGHNSLNSMLGVLHDVRDEENKNHNVGTIIGYLKAPCDYKNCWSLFKFEMEVPDYCNFLHVKLCGPSNLLGS